MATAKGRHNRNGREDFMKTSLDREEKMDQARDFCPYRRETQLSQKRAVIQAAEMASARATQTISNRPLKGYCQKLKKLCKKQVKRLVSDSRLPNEKDMSQSESDFCPRRSHTERKR